MADGMAYGDQLSQIERSLRTKLEPVVPNEQFIGGLRQRLEDSPIYQKQRRLAASLLSIAFGLVVGLIIFLLGRGLVSETEKG